jgi:hypothetical protein
MSDKEDTKCLDKEDTSGRIQRLFIEPFVGKEDL